MIKFIELKGNNIWLWEVIWLGEEMANGQDHWYKNVFPLFVFHFMCVYIAHMLSIFANA